MCGPNDDAIARIVLKESYEELKLIEQFCLQPYVFVSTVSVDRDNWGPQPDLLAVAGFKEGSLAEGGHYKLVNDTNAISKHPTKRVM